MARRKCRTCDGTKETICLSCVLMDDDNCPACKGRGVTACPNCGDVVVSLPAVPGWARVAFVSTCLFFGGVMMTLAAVALVRALQG